jgi:hypothetical protein
VEKNVSINLIADRATRVHGVQLSLGINWVDEELNGAQVAVAANITNGTVWGAQIAAGGNAAHGDVHGAQVAAGLNLALGELHGFQASAGGNYAQKEVVGFQSASGINIALRNVTGMQAAAGANWGGGNFTGLQTAAGFNGTAGSFTGLQAAVVNYAGEARGAQVGIVNVAGKSHGLQLGLVNISDEDHGVPIGLVSYARKNGIFRVGAYGTETTPVNAMLKIGGHNVYNTFSFGMRPGKDKNRYASALGLGLHTRTERSWLSFLDTEMVASSFYQDGFGDNDRLLILSSLRVLGGWRFADHFAITAGPTLNVLVRKRGFDEDIAPGALETVLHDGPTHVSLYPGLVLGVEI